MIAAILRMLTGGALRTLNWKPLAWLLGAVGIYAKIKMDDAKGDALRDAKAHTKTVKEVLDEEASHDDVGVIRDRMRERADRKP